MLGLQRYTKESSDLWDFSPTVFIACPDFRRRQEDKNQNLPGQEEAERKKSSDLLSMLENTLDLCIARYEIHQVSVAFKVKFCKDNAKIEAFQKSNSV